MKKADMPKDRGRGVESYKVLIVGDAGISQVSSALASRSRLYPSSMSMEASMEKGMTREYAGGQLHMEGVLS
jgi:hypothetical protein